jgi:hypothetical protein
MTCVWYEEHLANDTVELWSKGRPSSELLAHASECRACAIRLDSELALRESLVLLANSSRSSEPSPLIKSNLFAELERNAPAPAPRKSGWAFAFAAVVVLCAAAGLLFWRSKPQQPAVVQVQPSIPTPQVTPAPQVEQSAVAKAEVAAAPKPKRIEPRPQQQAAAPNDFYPVVMCDSLSCSGPMFSVRVELPASPLAIRSGGGNRTVMADLLVGEDGLVRGVRVLQ